MGNAGKKSKATMTLCKTEETRIPVKTLAGVANEVAPAIADKLEDANFGEGARKPGDIQVAINPLRSRPVSNPQKEESRKPAQGPKVLAKPIPLVQQQQHNGF